MKRYAVNGGLYPADNGLVVYYAEALAAIEEAVTEKDDVIDNYRGVTNQMRDKIAALTAYKENNYDPAESIRLNAEIIALTAKNKRLRNLLEKAIAGIPSKEYADTLKREEAGDE